MRVFPRPSQDLLIDHIYHSARLDRLPISYDEIRKCLKKKEGDVDVNPHAIGHFKAINFVLAKAPEENALQDIHGLLKKIHNLLGLPVAEHDRKTLNLSPLLPSDCGTYRTSPSVLGNRPCPNPMTISTSVSKLGQNLLRLDAKMAPKMTNSRLFTPDDLKEMSQGAYQAHLQLCALQPFKEASNRVARLFENLLRLHFQLPWIVRSSEEDEKIKLVEDVRNVKPL